MVIRVSPTNFRRFVQRLCWYPSIQLLREPEHSLKPGLSSIYERATAAKLFGRTVHADPSFNKSVNFDLWITPDTELPSAFLLMREIIRFRS
jgi:hypothetical protein